MKTVLTALLGTVASVGAAMAGAAVYVAPAVTEVQEPMRNGSGAWLIPLAIIAILALTLTGDSENQQEP